MTGISMVLNTAKMAIASNQVGLNVTGHNISNVGTESYSRQTPVFDVRDPIKLSRFTLGTGVDVDKVTRSSNYLIEKQLMNQNSELAKFEQAESYMSILESLFSETSESNLSDQISAFWNSWHDLSNTPTGYPERIAVYDAGTRMADQFQWLSQSMVNLQVNLEQEMQAGVDQINTITKQLGEINAEIVSKSTNDNPNDLLDKRNQLVNQLAQFLDLQTYEQPNSTLTIATNTGHLLVYGADSFNFEVRSGRLNWVNSLGGGVDISDKIRGGKLGGWLEMRDEVIPKYQQELNVVAENLIWSVNQQHSKGVGLDLFSSSLTGTYRTDNTQMFNSLDFGDHIDYTGDFRMWVYNYNVNPPVPSQVTVDMAQSTSGPNYAAATTVFSTAATSYSITATSSGTVGTDAVSFTWTNAAGGSGVGTMNAGNSYLTLSDGSRLDLNAGAITAGSTLKVNTDAGGVPDPLDITLTGKANSMMDTYKFEVLSGGTVGGPIKLQWSNTVTSGTISLDAGLTNVTVDGINLSFNAGTLATGDIFTITTNNLGVPTLQNPSGFHWTLSSFASAFNSAADAVAGGGQGSGYLQASVTSDNRLTFTPKSGYRFAFSDDTFNDAGVAAALGFNTFFKGGSASDIAVNTVLDDKDKIAAARISTTGSFGVGDNRNAIAIADIQYVSHELTQWTFDRRTMDRSSVTNNTLEGFYQGMIGAMGIKSASIDRGIQYSQVMAEKIKGQRDAISGVNLDEEMVNLMKYQHAFAVASKLLTTADEMMQTLLQAK